MFAVRKIVRDFFGRRKGDILVRPLDAAIGEHKAMLKKWNHDERKQIISALINQEWPCHHLRRNPSKSIAEMHRTHNQTGGEMV